MEVDPPLLEKPQHVPVNFRNEENNKDKIIYFSFATTGFLGQDALPCEIAVQEESEEKPLSIKIPPKRPFNYYASKYNGYTSEFCRDRKRELFKRGREVKVSPQHRALKKFFKYVSQKRTSSNSQKIILVGWFSQRYDIPLFFKLQCRLRLRQLERKGVCYACLLYTSPSPRDATLSRMPSSA